MSDTPMQLALREWHRSITKPMVWAVFAAIAAILALIGPFGTQGVLNLPTAFAYWLMITVVGYSVGVLVNGYADARVSPNPSLAGVILRGCVIGICVSCIVFSLNLLVFGLQSTASGIAVFVATVIAIAIIITWLLHMLFNAASPALSASATASSKQPALLDRLPLEKRGTLRSLSVEDHYVRVRTDKGEELVLMRLSDAIREANPIVGTQVHRSHWIAFDAVKSATRTKGRVILSLADGTNIPVSRANLPKIKEAGLLPR